jgi:Phosphodiester glycosidase
LCFDAAVTYSLRRDRLGDGAETTVYVVSYPLDQIRARVILFRQPRRLDWWCAKNGIDEAVVGGFYLRDPFRPLGELVAGGRRRASEPFAAPYGARRATLHAGDGDARIAPRAAIGISDEDLCLVGCDGRRSGVDAGLTLEELAEFMLALGCRDAMNLDGGGSTTLVHRGHLLNRPYSEQDQPAPASRPIVSAILVDPR